MICVMESLQMIKCLMMQVLFPPVTSSQTSLQLPALKRDHKYIQNINERSVISPRITITSPKLVDYSLIIHSLVIRTRMNNKLKRKKTAYRWNSHDNITYLNVFSVMVTTLAALCTLKFPKRNGRPKT
jgi:hypothetical protein